MLALEQLEALSAQAKKVADEVLDQAQLHPGQLLAVGCSTSTVLGSAIGTNSASEVGSALVDAILAAAGERGVFVCAQCCEHLNRAVILSAEAAQKYGYEPVNVVPQPKAGGSFATALYAALDSPVAVEQVQAHAGIDIGGVLIGMQLRPVAVPLKLQNCTIGQAHVIAARTRAKFIGGARAHYDDDLI